MGTNLTGRPGTADWPEVMAITAVDRRGLALPVSIFCEEEAAPARKDVDASCRNRRSP
jgi:hypothetical protein